MLWEEVIGQGEIIAQLREVIQKGRISHAYLFSGPPGVGKKTVAEVFAAAINCEYAPEGCGKCPSCVRIRKRIHPDIFLIEPEGNYITIGQARELQHEVNLKSFEARFRVFIIDEAHCLTEEAANALLKTLEEPPENIIFILITSAPEGLLPTIKSRCQLIGFKLIPLAQIIQILKERYGVDQEKAELIARVSKGVFGTALTLAEKDWRWERRRTVLEIAQKISRSDLLDLENFAERLLDEVKRPLEQIKKDQDYQEKEAREIAVSSAHAAYIKRTLQQRQQREINREEHQGLEEVLSIFTSWYRDLFILKEGGGRSLFTNFDYMEEITKDSYNLSSPRIIRAMEEIEKTKQLLRYNINPHLALENLLFKLGGWESAYSSRSGV